METKELPDLPSALIRLALGDLARVADDMERAGV